MCVSFMWIDFADRVQFEKKWLDKQRKVREPTRRTQANEESDHDSDSSFASSSGGESDVDESAVVPRRPGSESGGSDDEGGLVEYVDELGRTRMGTKKEATKAQASRDRGSGGGSFAKRATVESYAQAGEAYAEVMYAFSMRRR